METSYDDRLAEFEIVDIEELTDLSDEQRDRIWGICNSPQEYMETALKIQDKYGELIPFRLNRTQIAIEAVIKRLEAEGKPVRLIILKARQEGVTTYVSGRFFWRTATHENINSGIIAHVEKASTGILDKNKLFYDEMPELIKPMKKACNAKMLLFENPTTNEHVKRANPGLRSKMIIESAVNKKSFRSVTLQNLHVSELAFYPYPEETMDAALQAVPPMPGTAVIVESTANGIGGVFYDMWIKAINNETYGEDGGTFIPLFFPWYYHDEYAMPVPENFVLKDDEKDLKERYSLSNEQIAWRRWCIDNNCRGDIEKFHQEYPTEWEEAFLASGRPVFDSWIVHDALKKAPDPEFIGRVEPDESGEMIFKSIYGGRLSIWEKPLPEEHYVMGIDSSSGDTKGDPACIAIYNHRTEECVAEWHGFMPPEILAKEAFYLHKYYNKALLNPEANNHGNTVINKLREFGCQGHLLKRKPQADIKDQAAMQKYGFLTLQKSKETLIDDFAEFIRLRAANIRSKGALNECLTYVYDDSERPNAQVGCHDDRVIAHALCLHAIKKRPFGFKQRKPIDMKKEYGIDPITGF